MKRYLSIFISAILSGFCITFGATIYLLCSNKIVGATLFGLGLFTIIHYGLYLYTGKVGYVLDNKPKYFLDLLVTILGNFLGVFLLASIISLTRNGDALKDAALKIVEVKANDSWYSIFIQACMCGVMIYLAVDGHKKCEYPVGKALFAFLPIVVFIICGFEHCVANIAYFTYAHEFSFKIFGYLLLMIIGNGVGSICFDGLLKLVRRFKETA